MTQKYYVRAEIWIALPLLVFHSLALFKVKYESQLFIWWLGDTNQLLVDLSLYNETYSNNWNTFL
jgi:hypothetical protein